MLAQFSGASAAPSPGIDSASPTSAADRAARALGTRMATANALASALRRSGATRVYVRPATPSRVTKRARVAGVLPVDIFSVSVLWADWYQNGRKHVALYGRWNFRNTFIGSGSPYDATAMALSGFSAKCWTNVSTGITVQDQDGRRQNLGALRSSAHQSSIFSVQDRTRAFQLLNDMGMVWIDMRKDRTGAICGGRKMGKFYYEHNQSGNGGWTASVNLQAFSLSYSGTVKQKLKKASPITYYN